MNGTDWLTIVGATGGIIGAASGLTAIVIAIPATKAARKSADEAAAAVKLAREQRHHDLRPTPPSEILGKIEENSQFGDGHSSLMGSITLPQDFRVRATAIYSHSSSAPIGLPFVMHANQPQFFEIEQWSSDKTLPTVKKIKFRFWPPIEADDVEPWTCRCDRPNGDGGEADPGHWEWTVPVAYYNPLANIQ